MTGMNDIDIARFASFLKKGLSGTGASSVVPEETVRDYVNRNYSVVLTDDYAPVDNLIAPIFEARFGYNRKS